MKTIAIFRLKKNEVDIKVEEYKAGEKAALM